MYEKAAARWLDRSLGCSSRHHALDIITQLPSALEMTVLMTVHAFCRLTVYPETVNAADRWLDSNAGRSSPFAATIRLADGSGYARSSPWCPGMANDEPEAPEEHADRMEANAYASSAAPVSGKQLSTLSIN